MLLKNSKFKINTAVQGKSASFGKGNSSYWWSSTKKHPLCHSQYKPCEVKVNLHVNLNNDEVFAQNQDPHLHTSS